MDGLLVSLQRPLQYTDLRTDITVHADLEHWGQCFGCYRRVRVRVVELLQVSRRSPAPHWIARDFCGECSALVLATPSLSQDLYLRTG